MGLAEFRGTIDKFPEYDRKGEIAPLSLSLFARAAAAAAAAVYAHLRLRVPSSTHVRSALKVRN